jgi:hypothetical protein
MFNILILLDPFNNPNFRKSPQRQVSWVLTSLARALNFAHEEADDTYMEEADDTYMQNS